MGVCPPWQSVNVSFLLLLLLLQNLRNKFFFFFYSGAKMTDLKSVPDDVRVVARRDTCSVSVESVPVGCVGCTDAIFSTSPSSLFSRARLPHGLAYSGNGAAQVNRSIKLPYIEPG